MASNTFLHIECSSWLQVKLSPTLSLLSLLMCSPEHTNFPNFLSEFSQGKHTKPVKLFFSHPSSTLTFILFFHSLHLQLSSWLLPVQPPFPVMAPLALYYGPFVSMSPPTMPQSTTGWLSLLETPESSAALTLDAPSAVLGPSSTHTSFLAFLILHCDCRLAHSSPLLDCKQPK